ncbi:MAG TPA: type II CAAX endopeptidase family protein, partial [Egibacteraceae bacterium]
RRRHYRGAVRAPVLIPGVATERMRWRTPVRVVVATVAFLTVLVSVSSIWSRVRMARLPGLEETAAQAVGALLLSLAVTALTWVLCRGVDRRPLATTGLRLRWAAVGWLLVGTATAAALVMLVHVTALALGATAWRGAAGWRALAAELGVLLVSGLVAQGFPEELVFRGYVLTTLSGRRLGPVVAISAASFGVLHVLSESPLSGLGGRLAWVAMATAMGVLFSLLRLASRSLWTAVGAHGGFHLGWGASQALLPYEQWPTLVAAITALFLAASLLLVPLTRRRLAAPGAAPDAAGVASPRSRPGGAP